MVFPYNEILSHHEKQIMFYNYWMKPWENFFKSQSGEVLYKYYTKPEASKEKTDKFDYKKKFFSLQKNHHKQRQ